MGKQGKSQKAENRIEQRGAKGRLWVLGGLSLAGLLVVLLFTAGPFGSRSPTSTDPPSAYVRRETKATLSPALFVGRTAAAYRIAAEIPDVLDHLYCYCHCDKSIGHRSLLSCFTDTHAANCGVCQEEAFDAAEMLKKGYGIPDIKRRIDLKYGRI
jgi:hypothetical protein